VCGQLNGALRAAASSRSLVILVGVLVVGMPVGVRRVRLWGE
jgi:hypothetical protein